jgi:hypothetical protein
MNDFTLQSNFKELPVLSRSQLPPLNKAFHSEVFCLRQAPRKYRTEIHWAQELVKETCTKGAPMVQHLHLGLSQPQEHACANLLQVFCGTAHWQTERRRDSCAQGGLERCICTPSRSMTHIPPCTVVTVSCGMSMRLLRPTCILPLLPKQHIIDSANPTRKNLRPL